MLERLKVSFDVFSNKKSYPYLVLTVRQTLYRVSSVHWPTYFLKANQSVNIFLTWWMRDLRLNALSNLSSQEVVEPGFEPRLSDVRSQGCDDYIIPSSWAHGRASAWLQRASDWMYGGPRCDSGFAVPAGKSLFSHFFLCWMRLSSMGFKVNIHNCSLVFRERFSNSLQFFFAQTSHLCTIPGRPSLYRYSKAGCGWKVWLVPPWKPAGQTLCRAVKAKGFPCGARARQLWALVSLEKEMTTSAGTLPSLVPHFLTVLPASDQSHLIVFPWKSW